RPVMGIRNKSKGRGGAPSDRGRDRDQRHCTYSRGIRVCPQWPVSVAALTSAATLGAMYRQGDVLVVPVAEDKVPAGLIPAPRDRGGRMVLARGEATGHAHVVTGEGLTLLCLPDDIESMFLHVRVYGRVGHE